MKITYKSLVKPSLRLISLSAVLGIIAIFSLIFMNIFYNVQEYGISRYQLVFILGHTFILVVLINVANVLSASSSLDPDLFADSIRIGMIIVYLLLLLLNIVGVTADIPLHRVGIPPYIALYLLIPILFIVSSILIKRRSLSAEEKALYITGTIIDAVSAGIALGVLMYILGEVITYTTILIYMSGSIALTIFVWIDVENMLSRTVGKTSTATLWSIILRRIITATAGIVLGCVTLYFNAKAIADMIGYRWSLASVAETFQLLLLISFVISFVAILVGLVGGIMLIPSSHGARGIPLLIRMSRGESIDLSVLGISVGAEPSPQAYKPSEKPSKAAVPQAPAVVAQPQPAPAETKSRCSFCGAEIPANAKFCPYCGAYLAVDEGTRLYTEPK